ncbi:DegV family protein [Alloiococcus sp. CFN-8]|uniref:DegV family protein n=1 Tax=Alloiococcus sp. CFN-8 TaxID=3416081 RepID=UPI003CF28A36
MEKIALITDSSCDIDIEVLKEKNIYLLPFRIIYKDKEYADKVEISAQEVYSRLTTEIPSTSLPSVQLMEDTLLDIENKGYTHVIAVMISSNLSGTANSLRLMCENHPKLNCTVYDTKTLTMGQGSLVLECSRMIEEGKSYHEILEELPKLRKKTHVYFTIETLEYLRKGGRIGKVAGTIGEFLNLKPIIHVGDDGIYHTKSKARGKKQSHSKLLDIVTEHLEKGKCSIWLLNGGDPEDASKLMPLIKNHPNIVNIHTGQIGPALGVHTGPGLIGFVIKEES